MSSSKDSSILPEDLANLVTVEYGKLLNSTAENLKVLSACENQGFFYLHLPQYEYRDLWAQAEEIFAVAKEIFNQPLQEKMKFHMALSGQSEIAGYKPLGYHAGIIEGKRDGFEQFKIPRTGIMDLDPAFTYSRPRIVDRNWELFKNFLDVTHSIGTTILAALSTALDLPESQRFEKFHGTDTLSNSILACNKHPKHKVTDLDIGHNAHTDIGSVTILFAPEWGLQALQPGSNKWAYVRPLSEHIVINMGDSLRHMSQNRLRSSLHRVVPTPGVIEQADRYSFMYFLRPDRDAVFRDPEGNEYTSEQWHELKTVNFRKNHGLMTSSLQTGQTGFLGLWDTPVVSLMESGN